MIMQTRRSLFVAFVFYVAALLAIPSPARAEDTDIFFINPAIAGLRPNILIILDTSSNWSANDSVAADGTSIYQNVGNALAATIQGFVDKGIANLFNVGLMMYAETGGGNDNIDGGVIRAGVRWMNPTNADALVNFFKSVDGGFDKSNNTSLGLAFYEAYQYFSGLEAYAGGPGKLKRDYLDNKWATSGSQAGAPDALKKASETIWSLPQAVETVPLPRNALTDKDATKYNSPVSDACQKNFIIYISNGPITDPSSSNATAISKLAEVGGDTTTIDIKENDGDQANIADEWARFLYGKADVDTTRSGRQNVVTYALEVNPKADTQGLANTALLTSMSQDWGGGKYFQAKSNNAGEEIVKALSDIFTEVLAKNSVFASSTLPVSVNVRGTFLNQVYMGVFRPDGNASPRWPGNVKQFTLKATNAGLILVDKDGAAIENAGFISPGAKSYWTRGPVAPDTTGFWNTTYYPDVHSLDALPYPSDLPDGDLVEKGGAAQHLRLAYATDVTTRKLYTCIDSSFCPADKELAGDASTAFNAANSDIKDALLGITGPIDVSTLTRTGTLAEATTAAPHGFTTGQIVKVENAVGSEYNGTFAVTKVSDTKFSYTITESPPVTATTATSMKAVQGIGSVPVASITRSGGIATATSASHPFNVNDTVVIAGATGFDGNRTILTTSASDFTFAISETPVTPATVAGTAASGGVTKNIRANPTVGVTRVGTTVTVETTNNHGFTAGGGNTVTIAGVTPNEYNGTFPIVTASGKVLTYTLTAALGPADVISGTITASSGTEYPLSSITRSGSTATGTTSANHGLTIGSTLTLTISGADQSAYNGSKTATITGNRTFTYPVTVTPAFPDAGLTIKATGAGGVDRATLINWVRGANTQLNDNPNLPAVATRVRGYLHGDVLHSRPAVVNYNRASKPVDRDIVVYYGANDGIIHAVKGGQDDLDGDELWGFVPSEFYKGFARLYTESPIVVPGTSPRTVFADGPLSVDAVYVSDRIEGVGAKAQLFIGMRRGGRTYYSFDVTDPESPKFKWKIDQNTDGFSELGQSWSEMKVNKMLLSYPPSADKAARKVVIFGAGYDPAALDTATLGTATMGRGIYVVDAETGAPIWFAGPKKPDNFPGDATFFEAPDMLYAIPSDVMVINSDFDPDNFADRIYVGDTGGNVWRANIGDPDPANWKAARIAALGGTGADARRFLFPPDVVPFDGPDVVTTDSVLIGSGDREQPFDTAISNRFYMIKDAHGLETLPVSPVTESGLYDASANLVQDPNTATATAAKAALAAAGGWYIKMAKGEKTVTGSTTLGGTTIFATNTPQSEVKPGQCSGGLGTALLYAIDFKDASPDLFVMNQAGVATSRTEEREGGGFPPTPVPVSIKIGDTTHEGAITGTKVVTPATPKIGQRYRVFWNLSIDN